MSVYEVLLLGDVPQPRREALEATISGMIEPFGLALGTDVVIRDGAAVGARDTHAACAAAYFGGAPTNDAAIVAALVDERVPVIPTVTAEASYAAMVPPALAGLNALVRRDQDDGLAEVASALLECVGLLRRQRRAFVSYRRTESRAAALQLHDTLSAKGFDVFLDTHDLRPGETVRDELWHRLCDSDVVVMIDTPGYFASKWTKQELWSALAKDIHILRIVWPGHAASRQIDLSESIFLKVDQLEGVDGPLQEVVADRIVAAVERMRSRSIAFRHRDIAGKLQLDVEKIGGQVEGVGAHRAIVLRHPDGRRVWAYPVVGFPTAEMLHDVAVKARMRPSETAMLVYDDVGMRDAWAEHLKWLGDNITVVRAHKLNGIGLTLAVLEADAA